MYKTNSFEEEKDLAYDLRQTYAKIVGYHFELVSLARIKNNYFEYFKALEDVYLVIKHKFKEKDGDEEIYKKKRMVAIAAMNKYRQVYLGYTRDAEGVEVLSNALREMEAYLWEKADDANIFGGRWDDEGL